MFCRIESVGFLEIHGSLQRKDIILIDNDGYKLKFTLWGDQVILANLLTYVWSFFLILLSYIWSHTYGTSLFSVGSMLALDKPFISNEMEIGTGKTGNICLEYGSATQLYLVPLILQEEQVIWEVFLSMHWRAHI